MRRRTQTTDREYPFLVSSQYHTQVFLKLISSTRDDDGGAGTSLGASPSVVCGTTDLGGRGQTKAPKSVRPAGSCKTAASASSTRSARAESGAPSFTERERTRRATRTHNQKTHSRLDGSRPRACRVLFFDNTRQTLSLSISISISLSLSLSLSRRRKRGGFDSLKRRTRARFSTHKGLQIPKPATETPNPSETHTRTAECRSPVGATTHTRSPGEPHTRLPFFALLL